MQVRTQRELIETLSERWEKRFFKNNCWEKSSKPSSEQPEAKYNKLSQVDLSSISSKSIDFIKSMGFHASWISYYCSCCNEYKATVIESHKDEEYGEQFICFDCVEKMYDLVVEEKI